MLGKAALLLSSIFTGAAIYINVAEQPARLGGLPTDAALKHWKPAYVRGFGMQATLAVLAGSAGLSSYYCAGGWQQLAGGLLILANWPYTLLYMMPTNKRLMRTLPTEANHVTRELLIKWGRLHAVRSLLGAVACGMFLAAL